MGVVHATLFCIHAKLKMGREHNMSAPPADGLDILAAPRKSLATPLKFKQSTQPGGNTYNTL